MRKKINMFSCISTINSYWNIIIIIMQYYFVWFKQSYNHSVTFVMILSKTFSKLARLIMLVIDKLWWPHINYVKYINPHHISKPGCFVFPWVGISLSHAAESAVGDHSINGKMRTTKNFNGGPTGERRSKKKKNGSAVIGIRGG